MVEGESFPGEVPQDVGSGIAPVRLGRRRRRCFGGFPASRKCAWQLTLPPDVRHLQDLRVIIYDFRCLTFDFSSLLDYGIGIRSVRLWFCP